jgi:hypothetical protein
MLNPHDKRDETYGRPSDPPRAHVNPVFIDGDTQEQGKCHYTANTRVMPETQTDLYKQDVLRWAGDVNLVPGVTWRRFLRWIRFSQWGSGPRKTEDY